jgi:hypothetical protein
VRPYAKESPACAAFLDDIRAVYAKHGLALLAYGGSSLDVVELPYRWTDDLTMPLTTLEHALDARVTR